MGNRIIPIGDEVGAITGHRNIPYQDYLSSLEWKKKRQLVLDRFGRKCGLCSSSFTLHAHHRSYDRLRDELIRDLVCLCHYCHRRFHGDDRGTHRDHGDLGLRCGLCNRECVTTSPVGRLGLCRQCTEIFTPDVLKLHRMIGT